MRWAPDARGRLERAAFELFAQQGYAETTVPQITARAGLTTRTFFRYFADKREVIFGGDEIPEFAASLIRAAPPGLAPMEVVRSVLREVAAARFDGHREETAAWRRIVAADDSLRERDALKRADLVVAAQAAFVDRGEAPPDARLIAELGALVFHVALDAWLAQSSPASMAEATDAVLDRLHLERSIPAGPSR